MATKYDLFEFIYNSGIIKVQDVLKAFKKPKSDYSTVYQILIKLEREGLISKTPEGFQIVYSKKNNLLYSLINFCISNDINYNRLLDRGIIDFIKKISQKRKFSIKDLKLNPRTFKSYIDILYKDGFLIVLSWKPIIGTLLASSFLRDLLRYFGHTISMTEKKGGEYLGEIKKELKIFRRLKRGNERRYQEIVSKYEIRFIQHSLNLEGNPVTLPETIKLLQEHIIPRDMREEDVFEVQNYQKAVNLMLKDSAEKKFLTKEAILYYHFLAMQHNLKIAGKIRKVSVFIKYNPAFKVASVKEIEIKLDILLGKYNNFIRKKHLINEILSFFSYFHNEFQYIHPFIDGNSRTTRLLTFYLLRSQDIPIIDIPLGLLEEYLFSTKGAKKRDDKKLNRVLQLIILYNLKMINEQLK